MITVEPSGLGVSIAVPSDWGGSCDTGTSPRFSIGAPPQAAKLDVFSSRASVPLAALRPALVTELERRLGPRAVLAASPYTFDFGGREPWASRHATTFERSGRSIRFVQVA